MVRRENEIRELSEQFVNVRLIKCNHLDLHLFQFNYDLTFSVFFLNSNKTIYARYGTRSGHDADQDVHLEGLASTMRDVLKLHQAWENDPAAISLLEGKQPRRMAKRFPEEFESLSHFKPRLDYRGKVAKSCIHCHQVREAMRLEYRNEKQPLPEKLLFVYPSSQVLGITFDKKTSTTIATVAANSEAEAAGLSSGDKIIEFDQQLIHSEADFDWLLHHLPVDQTAIRLKVSRKGKIEEVGLKLSGDWRKKTDMSWRPTTWDLRRMVTGGLTLVPLNSEERQAMGLKSGQMALEATHVGMYGQHARARRAGMRKGDVIVSFDGKRTLITTNDLIEYALQTKKPGDPVEIVYLRGGKRRTANIRLQ